MPYVQGTLLANEKVVHCGRLHWMIYVSGLCGIFLGLPILGFGAYVRLGARSWDDRSPMQVVALIALLVGALFELGGFIDFFLAWIKNRATELAVTDQRVIIKTGIIWRRTIEMNLAKIENIQVDQSILGRILGYGTITVVGTGGRREPFECVADPLGFRKAVQAQSH